MAKQNVRFEMQTTCDNIETDLIVHFLKNPRKITGRNTENRREVGCLPGGIEITNLDVVVKAGNDFFGNDFQKITVTCQEIEAFDSFVDCLLH